MLHRIRRLHDASLKPIIQIARAAFVRAFRHRTACTRYRYLYTKLATRKKGQKRQCSPTVSEFTFRHRSQRFDTRERKRVYQPARKHAESIIPNRLLFSPRSGDNANQRFSRAHATNTRPPSNESCATTIGAEARETHRKIIVHIEFQSRGRPFFSSTLHSSLSLSLSAFSKRNVIFPPVKTTAVQATKFQ